jgi:hypothetical protein
MLPTHREIGTHAGWTIYQRMPGFEFTPVTLGKIASYILRSAGGETAVVAFMYSLLAALDGDRADEEALLADAVETIRQRLDASAPPNRSDTTFERRGDAWVEVAPPRWWIPFWG